MNTGFDFADSDSTANLNNDAEENEAVEVVPDYLSNEVGDGYLSFGDWKATLGKMLPMIPVPEGAVYTTKVEEGDSKKLILDELKVYGDDGIEDLSRLLGDYSDAHPMQKLHMVANLAKSTFGKLQRENDHTIGLKDGKAPSSHEEANGDDSYALFSKDLPAVNWEGLTGGELSNLEEMGIEVSELGFDTTFGGPKLLVIDGDRLPIAVEEGDEVMKAVEMLGMLPEEPSTWTEDDDLVASSDPSVFEDTEEDTDNPAEADSDDEEVDYFSNPEKVTEVSANVIRSGDRSVTHCTSSRTLKTMLRAEKERDKPRSTVIGRLEERIAAVGDSDEEAADTEASEEASDDEVEESVEGSDGLSDAEMTLASTLIDTGKAEDLADAKQQIRSL